MAKAVIIFGYQTLVMDMDKAVTMMEILCSSEAYEKKWAKVEDGGTTHHVYNVESELMTLTYITDSTYKMAKLAGKPGSV